MPAASRPRLVGLALPPGPRFVDELDRAWAQGDAVLPLDPAAPAASRAAAVAALRPHVLVEPTGATELPDGAEVDDGVALVIATSGSTGEPKGAQLSHAALEASARATAARIGARSDDRWLACLPWHHIGGLQVLLRARQAGVPVDVHPTFDPARVADSDATLVSLVPTQLRRLLDAGVEVGRFRVVLLGGAAAPPALLDRARAAGATVVRTYGMSETAGGCVYDGVPLDGVQVRLDEADGRVLLRGPVLMSGYRCRPDLTRQALVDGWLRTNDAGRMVAGRLVVRGRLDDVIVTGGENVVAAEVEAILTTHPAVDEAVVCGVPDDEWGQRVVAVVVARDGPPSLTELRRWVTQRAPVATAPRELVVVDEIPRLGSGKPDRLRVRALAQAAPACTPASQSAHPPSST